MEDICALDYAARMKKDVERFLVDLQAGRGFSPRTAEAYRRDLDSWMEFLKRRQNGTLPAVSAITPGHVTLYLADLTKTGKSARTVARHLAAIRSFSRYLRRHGVSASWAAEVRGPKLPKPVPSFLTEAEMEQLFRAETEKGPNALRDRAILEILYATGIRLAELVGMNRDENLELSRLQVKVMGKGGRERIVPFGAPAARALEAYLDETAGKPRTDRNGLPVFLGRDGARISRRTVQRLIEVRLSSVASRSGLSPHLLRHTMATHLLARMSRGEAAGGRKPSDGRGASDIRVVQELLGHVSLASTQVYTHVTVDRLRAALKTAHPRGED